MNDRIGTIRQKLTAACEAAIAKGLRIGVESSYGVFSDGQEHALWDTYPDACLCPMGAILLGKKVTSWALHFASAVELGLFPHEVVAFTSAFDGDAFSGCDPTFFALGQEFRAKYLGGVR